jgi:hypothetical protein
MPLVGTRTSPAAVALVGLDATRSLSNIRRPTGFFVPASPSLLTYALQSAMAVDLTTT